MTEKEKTYYLQRIDCNCNNCHFMERDLAAYAKWSEFHRQLQYAEWFEQREKLYFIAYTLRDKTLLAKARKMKFQFNKPPVNYGHCNKFNKPVTFIPNTCQIETQKCFVHRQDIS